MVAEEARIPRVRGRDTVPHIRSARRIAAPLDWPMPARMAQDTGADIVRHQYGGCPAKQVPRRHGRLGAECATSGPRLRA